VSAVQIVKAWQVPNLTPATRLVLLDLAECADHQGRNAYRSEQTIADWIQLSLRTVKRAVAELRERKLITVQELPRQRRSTTYQLHLGNFQRGQIVTPKPALVVTLGVTNQRPRGDKSHIAYKDDPVRDPVDPQLPALMEALHALMGRYPSATPDFLLAKLSQQFHDQLGGEQHLVLHAIKKAKGYAG
jgi:hypothetical protein